MDEHGGRARIDAGAALDLGGIGKGYAAARALEAMREAWPALPGALVDLGGDLAVWGVRPERGPWRIDVADPRSPGAHAGVLRSPEAASRPPVATSGASGPAGSLHHLIDPATGAAGRSPAPSRVTVVAPHAAEAEAHATALASRARPRRRAHVAANPQLSALVRAARGEPFALGALPLARTRVLVSAAS